MRKKSSPPRADAGFGSKRPPGRVNTIESAKYEFLIYPCRQRCVRKSLYTK
jgi:hypothetical protein